MKRNIMTKPKQTADNNRRFILDSSGKIVDKLHPERHPETAYYFNPYTHKPYDDEPHLRTGVFCRRLGPLVLELAKGNGSKRQRKAFSNELSVLLTSIVEASQLNREAVQTSLQSPFRGKLRHRKTKLLELTSISLFVDDVERLLRDLYGDVNSDSRNDLIAAIRSTALTLSFYLLPDLKAEYVDARTVDSGAGRGLPPGDGVSSFMLRSALEAAQDLVLRVRKVLSSQGEYGRYTVGFANALREYWPAVQQWRPLRVEAVLRDLAEIHANLAKVPRFEHAERTAPRRNRKL
jgi:hypothetical protein